MATTAATIVRGALETIGVVGEGQTLDSAKLADGFRRLNLMMGSWAIQSGTIPVIAREVFDLVANQTSYTIGPGGNFDTEWPSMLVGAGTILTASTPTSEVPLTVFTDNAYESLITKGLSNGLANGIYYEKTVPLGTIRLWPVVNTAINDLVLYLQKPLTTFAAETTQYDFPPGAEEAIEYNLAVRLCGPYSVPVDPDVKAMARSSLAIFKRSNYRLVDLPSGWYGHGRYDIYSGNVYP